MSVPRHSIGAGVSLMGHEEYILHVGDLEKMTEYGLE